MDPEDDDSQSSPDSDFDPNSSQDDPSDDGTADTQFVLDPDNPDAGEEQDSGLPTEDGDDIEALSGEEDDERSQIEAHFANLAEEIDEDRLASFASELIEALERDADDRSKRDEAYAEGLRRTGLSDDAPGGADFEGASKVVHPVLTEVSIDFAAKAVKELFPPNGPVKDSIIGAATRPKVDKAKRKTRFMNWQLTEEVAEFRADLEQILSQVPLGGAQYLKLYWDDRLDRPRSEPIFIDHVLMPYAASSWASAERKTHVQKITEAEFKRRVKSGQYRDIPLGEPESPEATETEQANDAIEGREADATNLDGIRTIYETAVHLDIETDGEVHPYLISIDKSSHQFLSVYRNWDFGDDNYEEMQWIVEFPFIPWRGAYPIGLPHMIGGLAAASTGAIRALLDSAHINNSPTLLKLKAGGSKGGQNLRPKPGEVLEIEGGVGPGADIRALVMAPPFNAPSPVLLQLLGLLSDTAKGVVTTALEDVPDQRADAPVGTTLALIEQGMSVFSAIHARLHAAMKQVLKILHRLNAQNLEEREVIDDLGEVLVRRADFQGPMDVIPVSDPNIFSEQQRFAQVQAIVQRSDLHPGLYDPVKVEELLLERLKIPNGKDLLAPRPTPQHLIAVNENVAASMGKPVVVFPEQDHIAHIQTHLGYLKSPLFGGNPLVGTVCMPLLLNHIKDHIPMWYAARVYELTKQMAEGYEPGKMFDEDPEVGRAMDRLMAKVSDQVLQEAQQILGPFLPQLMPIMAQMQQVQQQKMQQASAMNPQTQVGMADIQQRGQAAQMKNAVDMQELQIDAAKLQQNGQIELQREQAEQQREQQREQSEQMRVLTETNTRERINTQDNQTAVQIAGAKLLTGHSTDLMDGAGINPRP